MATAKGRSHATAVTLFTVVAAMVGLSFASVPLYELFCKVTGYGGTPRTEAVAPAPGVAENHFVTVRFDANVNSAVPWHFRAEERTRRVRIGEENLAFYVARNDSDTPVTGTATFNVAPFKAAPYFTKIDCFCFTEQTLAPGEEITMPVLFYVDPDILDDVDAREVTALTLSYTFYPTEKSDTEQTDESPAVAATRSESRSGG